MATGTSKDFVDKVVLITGAASGIAAETAVEFARRGAILSLIDVNSLEDTREKCKAATDSGECKVLELVGDLTQTSVCERYVQQSIAAFGRIDVLVNCVGILQFDSTLNANMDIFDKVFAVNTRITYQLSSLCVPHLIRTKGNIVNVSSASTGVVLQEHLSYSMSKAAIELFTRNTAVELGPYGVRVNSIRPGVVHTNLTPLKHCEKYGKKHSLERCGTTAEIATAIAFIASPRNSFMTGSNILCDGGVTLGHF